MPPIARSVRHFLLSPSTFFEDRPPAETLPIAAGIVVLFAVSLVAAIWLLGWMFADTIEGTVTMDNPNRPPDPICEGTGNDPDSLIADRCDEPETIERNAGKLVQEALQDFYGYAFVAPFVLWLVGGGVLYVAGRVGDGTPSFSGTLALAGWAAVPEFVRLAATLVAVRIALADVTITNPEREVHVLEAALASTEPVLLVVSLVTVGWQWYLLTGGLTREADVPWGVAAVDTGVPLGILFLLGLA